MLFSDTGHERSTVNNAFAGGDIGWNWTLNTAYYEAVEAEERATRAYHAAQCKSKCDVSSPIFFKGDLERINLDANEKNYGDDCSTLLMNSLRAGLHVAEFEGRCVFDTILP